MDSDPDLYWIRIGIQPKMLDPDPFRMNTDPKPCLKSSFGIRIKSGRGKRWNRDIFRLLQFYIDFLSVSVEINTVVHLNNQALSVLYVKVENKSPPGTVGSVEGQIITASRRVGFNVEKLANLTQTRSQGRID